MLIFVMGLPEREGMRYPIIYGLGKNIGKYDLGPSTKKTGQEYGLQVFSNEGTKTFLFQKGHENQWGPPAAMLNEDELVRLIMLAKDGGDAISKVPDDLKDLSIMATPGRIKSRFLKKEGVKETWAVKYQKGNETRIKIGHRNFGIPSPNQVDVPVESVIQMQYLLVPEFKVLEY